MAKKKVALACQGGGTHAAFTWGVLRTILRTKQQWDAHPEDGDTFDIVAVSGTSAGALCALAAWYGLVPNTADADCGSIDKAVERLDHLWTTFAATTPAEIVQNWMSSTLLRWRENGAPIPGFNPYDPWAVLGVGALTLMGARPQYLSFPALLDAVCPNFATIDWPQVAKARLRILVGAIEVLSGNFELFDSDQTLLELDLLPARKEHDQYSSTRWRMRRPISLLGVAASATLPEILPAQEIAGMRFPTRDSARSVTRSGYYWDGLYSQNPPTRDLLDSDAKEEKPDEIWVVRINPQQYYPSSPNISLEQIRDRQNELAGNLSLHQELDHILTMNRWIEKYGDTHPPLNNRKKVEVRTIKMTRETAWGLRAESTVDRSPAFLARLRDEGCAVTDKWLTDWRAFGADFASYPNDARYT